MNGNPMQLQVLQGPYPSRKATKLLREQLIGHLVKGGASVGDPFFSDASLMKMSGLSRQTVRRALNQMHREGWIQRLPGKGSFVGPRAAMPLMPVPARSPQRRTMVRLAVVAHEIDQRHLPDWYSRAVLAGIDSAAMEEGVTIEFIGSGGDDVRRQTDRLMQGRPDVLVLMLNNALQVPTVAAAQTLGIPCINVTMQYPELGLPMIYEDGEQGSRLAVDHLVKMGHRRIGMLLSPSPVSWIYPRYHGFLKALAANGLEADERLTCWMPTHDREYPERVWDFLQRSRPTALVLGSVWQHVRSLGAIQTRYGLRIPEDLSVVSFDQAWSAYQIYLGIRATVVSLPLEQMGREAARMARQIVEKKQVPLQTRLPCQLLEGDSVKAL